MPPVRICAGGRSAMAVPTATGVDDLFLERRGSQKSENCAAGSGRVGGFSEHIMRPRQAHTHRNRAYKDDPFPPFSSTDFFKEARVLYGKSPEAANILIRKMMRLRYCPQDGSRAIL